jgi:tripartite-type tricarboxylate transporter receptor subunit TctC
VSGIELSPSPGEVRKTTKSVDVLLQDRDAIMTNPEASLLLYEMHERLATRPIQRSAANGSHCIGYNEFAGPRAPADQYGCFRVAYASSPSVCASVLYVQRIRESAMELVRRHFMQQAAGAATLAFGSRAHAQSYPARPVRLVVGFTPGGGNDIVARIIGQWLSDRLGQSFVVDNKPGAASSIAAELVVRAAPDGYTLLFVGLAHATNATLYENLTYNFVRDIAPVSGLISYPNVMVVHPSLPATTGAGVPRLWPGPSGQGQRVVGRQRLGGPSLRRAAQDDDRRRARPHPLSRQRAGARRPAGGPGAVTFASSSSAMGYVASGKLRALAVTGAERIESLPDVPTIAEFVPGYEMTAWYGIGAPRNTPAEIVDTLNREINSALAASDMKARFTELGGTVLRGSPADFARLIASDTEKWAKVIKFAGIKLT